MELMDLPDGERDGLYELYFEPLSVYYNITPYKGLKTERRLGPAMGGNPPEYRVLGGIRVKIESDLSVFEEKYLIDGYEWSGTGGRFYRGYHVDSPEDRDLRRYKVYWESPEDISYRGSIRLNVRYRKKSLPQVREEMGEEIRMLTRELRRGLSGDDVMMFQDLLNWLGWDRYTSTHKRRIDGVFEDTTVAMFTKFTHMNWASNYPATVNASVLHLLNLHYDDYRNALNRYGWHNGISSNTEFATMGRMVNGEVDTSMVSRIEEWVALADNEVTTRLPSYSTLGMNPTHIGDDDYPQGGNDSFQWLIIKIIEQETGFLGYAHWINWRIVLGESGDLGFVQMMSYNVRRYNNLGDVPDMNIYKPEDNIKSCAYHIRPIINQAYAPTGQPNRPYAWMVIRERYQGKIYTDTPGDLIGKVCAVYNGGRNSAYASHAWENIVANRTDFPRVSIGEVCYGISLKKRLGIPLSSTEKNFWQSHCQ